MGFSYRKSFKVGKNSRISVGKNGVGFSTGSKGTRVSVNQNGKVRVSAGRNGVRYTKSTGCLMPILMIILLIALACCIF